MRLLKILRGKAESVLFTEALLKDALFSFPWLLLAASKVYGGVVRAKNRLFEQKRLPVKRLPCWVISVGNLTVGGTGKTPMTTYVAKKVAEMGYRTAVLSRGYRGKAEKKGGVVRDQHGIRMTAEAAGDEPYMMACQLPGIPVLVGGSRYKNGLRAIRNFQTQVLILDDAFQHRKLHRDMDLLLFDGHRPFGNFHLLPRGPLREPPESLRRCSAIVLVGEPGRRRRQPCAAAAGRLKQLAADRPVFEARKAVYLHRWLSEGGGRLKRALSDLTGIKVFAFSGVADNAAFHRSLSSLGAQVAGSIGFPDHYWYRNTDLHRICREAAAAKAAAVVTTEKDYVRLPTGALPAMELVVMGLNIQFDDEGGFQDYLLQQFKTGPKPDDGVKK